MNRSVSRILYPDEIGMAIIHLGQSLPIGSSDLPGGRSGPKSASGGQPWLTPPYLVLHREEFAWPRMSPHAPVRSYRTVSPITARVRRRERLVCFLLHLSSSGSQKPSDAPPLAGSLPYSVRTFLSRLSPAATARPVLLQGGGIIANECSTELQSVKKTRS